ncbi:hypothetical protein EJ110_NYTH21272 [Nymphaea thermarum]|nr:hypothetical protein EJ110_NYTH21272 [Nymphaea thermarum]
MEKNDNPDEVFSVAVNGLSCPLLAVDWNKKRKLEDLELAVPLPKLKCLVQSSDRCKNERWNYGPESVESVVGIHKHNLMPKTKGYSPKVVSGNYTSSSWTAGGCSKAVVRSEDTGSCSGSNSFMGEYEATISFDIQGEAEETTTCPENCSRSTFRSTAHSPAFRTMKRKTGEIASSSKEPKAEPKRLNSGDILDTQIITENLEESSKYQSEFPYTEDDHLLGLDINYADLVALAESHNAVDDAFLHIDDPFSPFYLLQGGGWNADKDSQQAERKPTIDQEFEQYFSSLML